MSSEPKPLESVMAILIGALTFTAIAYCMTIVFDVHRLGVLNRIQTDIGAHNIAAFAADRAGASTSDSQTASAAIVEICAYAIAAIAFLVWFYTAYANLPRLGAKLLRYQPGWAIGAWFIPVLSLFQPKRMADDIWRGSDPTDPHDEPDWGTPVSPVLHFWWAAFLLTNIVGLIGGRLWDAAHTISALKNGTSVDIASAAAGILAATLAACVAYLITDRQRQRVSARLATEPPSPPPTDETPRVLSGGPANSVGMEE